MKFSSEELRSILRVETRRGSHAITCSGVLVHDAWLLTAKHCEAGAEVTIATDGAGQGYKVSDVFLHATADVALLALERPVAGALPFRYGAPNTQAYLGSKAQVAGYGFDTDGVLGRLAFQVVTLVDVSLNTIVVSGDRSGACFGDSGAPLFSRGADGQAIVLGTLSGGDPSCIGIDQYVRADAVASWLAEFIAPKQAQPLQQCREVGEVGRCYGRVAAWCNGSQLETSECVAPATCGWNQDLGRFGCTTDDSCDGLDELGACDGDRARHCIEGTVLASECACGGCAVSGATGRAECNDTMH